MFDRLRSKIMKNIPDLHRNEKKVYITQPISQKNGVQEDTNVSLPSEENVVAARNWVNQNKK